MIKKKIYLILLLGVLCLSSCGKEMILNKEIEVKECYVVLSQKDDELFVHTYKGSGDEINAYKLCDLPNDLRANCKLYTDNNKNFYICVENAEGTSAEIYGYQVIDKKVKLLGNVECANENIVIANEKLYTYAKDTIRKQHMIYAYDLSDLSKKIEEIKIPNAAEKLIYNKKDNHIYISALTEKNASELLSISLKNNAVKQVEIDSRSVIGDIACNEENGNCYVSLIGYCDIDENEYDDNRIVILNSKLNTVDTIKLKDKNISQLVIKDDKLYALAGKDSKRCVRIDLASNTFETVVDYDRDVIYDMSVKDDTVCFLSDSQVGFEHDKNIISVNVDNMEISTVVIE